MLDAAALAAILDPERKVPGWWTPCWTSPDFGGTPVENLPSVCKFNDWYFIGPPDLHTAREHAWRMEDWLVKHGYQIVMRKDKTIVWESGKKWHETSKTWSSPNHTAALVAAIERIHNEVR